VIMAKTKLYAPKGTHFMIKKQGGFYLMKNPASGYKEHTTANGERSALYVFIELKESHESLAPTTVSTPRQSARRTPTRRTTTTTNRTTSTPRSSSGSSSGGGY